MRSLGVRLAVVISAVLFLLMSVAGLWLDRQLTDAMRGEEVRQAQIHGSTLLASLQTLMLNGQGTLARSWLDRMHGEAGIINIEVYRRDGVEAFTDVSTVQAVNDYLGYPRFERMPSPPEHPGRLRSPFFEKSLDGKLAIDWTRSGQLTLFMPIERHDECLACHGYEDNALRGVLKLSLSTLDSEARITSMRYRLWGISGGLVTLLGVALWLVLRVSVLKRIAHLRDAISRVGEGDRDAKLTITQQDELGEVSMVFNKMQEQLVAGETRIRAVMDSVADAVITIDERGIIESVNRAVKNVFGYAPEDLLGKNVNVLMPSPYHEEHDQYLANYLQTGSSRILGVGREVMGRRKDGVIFPMDIAISEMRIYGRRYFVGIVRDITERKEQMAAIEYQALHDALTDLPNRTLLSDRLHQAILSASRGNQPLSFIIMDLDRFKEINDTLGHHNGDLILQQVTMRVKQVLRESDTVARLGGDEFAVLLPAADVKDATQIAKKLLGALDRPFELEAQSFHVGASLGIALFPEHGTDGPTLMKRADVAMYEAKRNKTGYAIYDAAKDQHSLRDLSLMGELRAALDNEQLVLHYQPKVNVQTGRVSGVEALVRWRHPQHGLVFPNDFIPLAEQSGLIKQLTLWVVRHAVRQNRDWLLSGIDLSMAINLSVHNLHDSTFPEEVKAILQDEGCVDPHRLRFEITESAMMVDPDRALAILNSLGEIGIRLSIDDFGTGYSSLAYLKQLPVAELKIDKSFITAMTTNENDAVIVRSTIDMAHNIGLRVVAEGVEDKASYEALAALGCDSIQGYYISRPVSAEEFVLWLQYPPWGQP